MNNKFLACACLLAFLAPVPAQADAGPAPDAAVLAGLNGQMIQAFLHSDVARYRELLADDFTAILADGRQIGKAEFLEAQRPGMPAPIKDFQLDEVEIRQFGDTGLVGGRISYLRNDGVAVQHRYLEVYVRRGNRWQAVSGQLTPIREP